MTAASFEKRTTAGPHAIVRRSLGVWQGTALILSLVSTPGMAQYSESGTSRPGAEATDQGGGLTEVVVTARKREESVQDAPISITVATGSDLENRSVLVFSDLQFHTPGLRVTPSVLSSSTSFISMRGQAVTNTRLTNDPAVGLYVDGVYIPRTYGTDASEMFDISRVEVLKGPQGTLYGRSTTGGSVNIWTNTPTDEFESTVRVRAGNFSQLDFAGMLNLPLGETTGLRLVATRREHNGYGRNLTTGGRLGNLESHGFRGTFQWDPAQTVGVTLRADYSKVDGTATPTVPGPMVPGSVSNRAVAIEAGLPFPDAAEEARALYESYANLDPYDGAPSQNPHDTVSVWGASATVDWQISDALTFKSISAYRALDRASALDFDGTPFLLFDFNDMRTDSEQVSQELQLLGEAMESRLQWILGGFWSRETGNEFLVQTTLAALGSPPSTQDNDVENRSVGVFVQATYALTDRLSVTAGVRHTEDTREVVSRNRDPVNCRALGQPLAAGPCSRHVSVDFSEPSYTASLEYKPAGNWLLYAKTNRGYRSGVIDAASAGNPSNPDAATDTYTPVRPEITTDYEVGLKADWLDRRLRTNVAVYHSKYKDIQRSASDRIPGTNTVVGRLRNAAKASISGVELEVSARPVPSLELLMTSSYTDASFDEYMLLDAASGTLIDVSWRPLVLTPEWAYSLSAAYTANLGFGQLRMQADYSWEDEALCAEPSALTGPLSDAAAMRESMSFLNARLSLDLDRYGLTIAAFGKNLTDKTYYLFSTDTRASIGFLHAGAPNAPRTYGIELTKRFGQ